MLLAALLCLRALHQSPLSDELLVCSPAAFRRKKRQISSRPLSTPNQEEPKQTDALDNER